MSDANYSLVRPPKPVVCDLALYSPGGKKKSRSNQVDQIWDIFRAGYAPVQSGDFGVRSMSFWQPIGMGRIKKSIEK